MLNQRARDMNVTGNREVKLGMDGERYQCMETKVWTKT